MDEIIPARRADIKPDPDPTRATVDFVERAVGAVRVVTDVRIAGIERAADVFAENLNRVPTTLDREISKLAGLVNEKFHSIEVQFAERDQRTGLEKQSATVAVNAALQAQKEAASAQNESNLAAVKKSDDATTKQIDGILLVLAGNKNALDEKIGAINSRLDRGDGGSGARQVGFGNSASIIIIIVAGLGLLLSAANTMHSITAHP
jgi:hypothetical protein